MDVKWVRLDVDFEQNPKIKRIKRQPNGDSMVLFWISLLCNAGRCNDGGRIWLTPSLPCAPDDFEGFKPKLVKDALALFQKLEMISVDSDGYITVCGWAEHQNADGMERLKRKAPKSDAERAAEYRARKKERDSIDRWGEVSKQIDDHWETSSKARGATAQIIVDYLVSEGFQKKSPSLFEAVYDGMSNGFTPDEIAVSGRQEWAVFASRMECVRHAKTNNAEVQRGECAGTD